MLTHATSSLPSPHSHRSRSKAAFFALRKSYGYLSPDLWAPTVFLKSPYQEFTDLLQKEQAKAAKAI